MYHFFFSGKRNPKILIHLCYGSSMFIRDTGSASFMFPCGFQCHGFQMLAAGMPLSTQQEGVRSKRNVACSSYIKNFEGVFLEVPTAHLFKFHWPELSQC